MSLQQGCSGLVLCKARPEAVSQAKPSPNRPGQAGPIWRLHGGFGLACVFEKPKPSRQAAAFRWVIYMWISYYLFFKIHCNTIFSTSIDVTYINHRDSCYVTPHFSSLVPPLPPKDCSFQKTVKRQRRQCGWGMMEGIDQKHVKGRVFGCRYNLFFCFWLHSY